MTQAELNILVRVRSAAAMTEIRALQAEMAKMKAAGAASGAAAAGAAGGAAGLAGMRAFGSQLQWTGRQLAQNFTAPLVIAGGFALKWQLDNERAMTEVKKVYGDATMPAKMLASEINALDRSFTELSNHYGVQKAQVTEIAGAWAAAGSSGLALAKSTELTMQAMVIGGLDATKTTEGLIAIQAQYGLNSAGLTNTLAQLNMVENITGASMGDLIEGFSKAAGTARGMGVDTQHLAAMMATLVPATGKAAQAGNGLKTIISRIMSPTKDAAQIMGLLGINTADMAWKSLNATQRIEMMSKKFVDLDASQQAVAASTLGSIYQISRLEVLFRDVASGTGYYQKSLDGLADQANVTKVMAQELNTVLMSNPQMMKQAGVIIQNSMTKAIVPLVPYIAYMALKIGDLFKAFANMNPIVQKFIMLALLLIAVLGPITLLIGTAYLAVATFGRAILGITPYLFGLVKALLFPITGLFSLAAGFTSSALMAGASAVTWLFSASTMGVVGTAAKGLAVIYTFLGKTIWATGLIQKAAVAIWFAANNAMLVITGARVYGIIALERSMYAIRMAAAWVYIGASVAAEKVAGAARLAAIVVWHQAVLAAEKAMSVVRFLALATFNQLALAADIGSHMVRLGATRAFEMLRLGLEKVFMATRFASTWAGLLAINAIEKAAWVIRYGTTWAGIMLITAAEAAWRAVTITGHLGLHAAIFAISAAGWARTAAVWIAAQVAMMGGVKGLLMGTINMFILLFTNLPALVAKGMRLVALAMSGPIGWGIAAVVALLVIFKDQIGTFISNIIAYFKHMPAGVAAGFQPLIGFFHTAANAVVSAFNKLPEGIQGALMAVVNMVRSAAMAVYKLFSYLNPFAHHSPSLVENVTNGMQVIGDQFGLAAGRIRGSIMSMYGALQWFGSATANFMNGVAAAKAAETRGQIGQVAPEAIAAYDNLVGAVARLKPELDVASRAVDAQQSVVTKLDGAVKQADSHIKELNYTLDGLKDAASRASTALDAAKASVDKYANAPLAGMRATEDAIFQNEMAQKRLQLQIAQTNEEAVGGTSDVRDEYARLQGDIEKLTGQQTDLRNKGAGSDITSTYDRMIKDTRDAQRALTASAGTATPTSPVDALKAQLDALQKQAEVMDLEKALRFDPLTRQVNQLATGMHELPFDQIMAGLSASQSDVGRYTAEMDQANAAVRDQQAAVDSATRARDALSQQYDVENNKLSALKDVYDGIKESIQEATSALEEMGSAASSTIQKLEQEASERERIAKEAEAARKKAERDNAPDKLGVGAQNFVDAAGGDFADPGQNATIGREGGPGDQTAAIDQFTNDMADQTAHMFDTLNIMGPFKKKWDEFTGWWSSTISPAWNILVGGLKEGFKPFENMGNPFTSISNATDGLFGKIREIGVSIKNFGSSIAEWAGKLASLFGPDLQSTLTELKNGFMDLWDKVWPSLKNFFDSVGPLFNSLGPILAVMVGMIAAVVQVLWEMVNGALGPLFSIIGAIISTIVDVVTGVVKIITGVINTVIGVIKMAIGIIKGVFTGDWSMFADGWNKVKEGFGQIFSGIIDIVWGVLKGIISVFVDGAKLVWNVVYGFIKGIIDFFVWLWDELVGHSIVPDLINGIIDWFVKLPGRILSLVWNFIKAVVGFFWELPGKIGSALGDLAGFLWSKFQDFSVYLVANMPGWIGGILSFFFSLPGKILGAIGDLAGFLWGKFVEFSLYLGENMPGWIGGILEFFVSLPGKIFDAIGDLAGFVGRKFWDFIYWVADNLPTWAQGVWDFFTGLPGKIWDLLGDLNQAIGRKIWEFIYWVADNLPGWAQGVWDFFTGLPGKIWNLLGDLTQSIGRKFWEFIYWAADNLPIWAQGIWDFFSGLPGKVFGLLGDLGGFLGGKFMDAMRFLAEHLPGWADAVWTFFKELPGKILDFLGDAGKMLGQFGKDILMGLINGVKDKLTDVKDFFGSTVPDAIKGAFKGALGISSPSKMFAEYGGFIGEGLIQGLQASGESVARASQGLANSVANIVIPDLSMTANVTASAKVVDTPAVLTAAPTLSGPVTSDQAVAQTAATSAIWQGYEATRIAEQQVFFDTEQTAYDAHLASILLSTVSHIATMQTTTAAYIAFQQNATVAFSKAQNDNYVVMYAGIINTQNNSINSLQTSFANYVALMTRMTEDLRNVEVAIFTDMSNILIARVTDLVNLLIMWFTTMRDMLTTRMGETRDRNTMLFQSMSDNFANIMDRGIRPVFDSFLPMLQNVEGWFGQTVGNIGRIWDGMREAVAGPSRFIVNEVYNAGVKEAWNKVNGWLNLPALPDFVARFATGGPVFGAGTATSDSIPALLSNQEHVITAKEVKGAGGHAAVEAQRAAWRQGAGFFDAPVYARGGPVRLDAPAWGGGGGESNLQPAAILARRNIHMYYPEITTIGGYRAVDAYPDHPSGLALDIMNSTDLNTDVNEWLHREKNALALNYTIWRQRYMPAGGGGNIMEDRGSPTQNHMDHIHALFNNNGVPSIEVGGVGGGTAAIKSMSQRVEEAFRSVMDPIKDKIGTNDRGVNAMRKSGYDKFDTTVGDFLKKKASETDALTASIGGLVTAQGSGPVVDQVKAAVKDRGWDVGPQWDALNTLIAHESSWNPTASAYPASDAYGLFQFLSTTWAGVGGQKTDDPYQQAVYGARYIAGRYGDPIEAWRFWNSHSPNWYDEGGYMMPGVGIYNNQTGKPEPVFSPTQWQTLQDAVYRGATVQGYDSNLAKEINDNLAPTLKNLGLNIGPVSPWTTQDVINGVQQVVSNVQQVADNVITGTRQQVEAAWQQGAQQVEAWAQGFGQISADFFVGFGDFAAQAAQGFANVQTAIESLLPDVGNEVNNLAPKFADEIGRLAPAFDEAMRAFQTDPAGAIGRFLPHLAESASRLAPYVGKSIDNLAPKFEAALNGTLPAIRNAAAAGQSATGGSSLGNREGMAGATVQPNYTTITDNSSTTINMNGDLIFPGVSTVDGADKFIANLKTRAGVS